DGVIQGAVQPGQRLVRRRMSRIEAKSRGEPTQRLANLSGSQGDLRDLVGNLRVVGAFLQRTRDQYRDPLEVGLQLRDALLLVGRFLTLADPGQGERVLAARGDVPGFEG